MSHKTNKTAVMTWITAHPSEVVEIHAAFPDSTRAVEVYVPGQVFKDIAEILKHTDHIGHAFWHYENPEMPIPCECCKD